LRVTFTAALGPHLAHPDGPPAMLVSCLMSAATPLYDHLLRQGAPLAAARLLQEPVPLQASAPRRPEFFAVAAEAVRIVDDQQSALACAAALQLALEQGGAAAIDCEWEPEVHGHRCHTPSLLQIAWRDEQGEISVWLIDLELLWMDDAPRSTHELELEAALGAVLSSEEVVILGFSVATDIAKLRMLPLRGSCFCSFTRIVDLREACDDGGGLSSALKRWTGVALDKTEQCSQWQRRPLSPRQVSPAHLRRLAHLPGTVT